MKKFERPEIEIEEIEVLNVIAVSGCTDDVVACADDNELDERG